MLAWSFHEFLLYMVSIGIIPLSMRAALSGLVIGSTFGGFIGAGEGFFYNSKYKFKKGTIKGVIFGLVSGIISFQLVDQFVSQIQSSISNPLIINVLYASRWLIVSVSIGLSIGFKNNNHLAMIRGVISGVIAGLIGGIIITCLAFLTNLPFWSRGVGYVIFSALFSGALYHFSSFGRRTWLMSLNGRLEGLDIELSKDIHFIGTQDNDDIDLRGYQDVQQSHARLIKYFNNYSLIDNDPFCQTSVNYRNIKEQFLKNGDILKVGAALFQYCSID